MWPSEFSARFTNSEGVLFVGRAQEKALVWRTQRRYSRDGASYAWLVQLHRVCQPLLFLVRHEAPCCIPDLVRRNLEEYSWV